MTTNPSKLHSASDSHASSVGASNNRRVEPLGFGNSISKARTRCQSVANLRIPDDSPGAGSNTPLPRFERFSSGWSLL